MTSILRRITWLVTVFLLPHPILAQEGGLAGQVVDTETKIPIEFASVSILDNQGHRIASTVTGPDGVFSFTELPAEVILVTTRIGYVTSRLEEVLSGTGESLEVALAADQYVIAPLVVTASRRRETGFEAPASVSVIDGADIEKTQSFTPVDVLQTTPGIVFSRKGMLSSTYNSRGRAGVNNGSTLILQDYRYTRLPFLQYNIPYLHTPTPADIDRIEVIRGPGAALYGPEGGANGVVNIITRSPFESQGTTLSLAGGEQSLFDGWFRNAGTMGENLGYAISGRYTSASDWVPSDTLAAVSGDDQIRAGTTQARIEWWADDQTLLSFAGGIANVFNQVEQVPAGYFQQRDFSFWYLQPMLQHKTLKINLMYNQNSMGESYLLPSGEPVVDESQLLGAQVQDERDLKSGSVLYRLSYGLDWRNTRPRTGGTLTGRFEDNDTITEVGAFLQSTTVMNPQLDLVGSIRVDYHDRVDEGVALPFRLGAVYKPAPTQVVRLTFNRLTEAPPNVLLFSDIYGGGQFPYELTLAGTPKSGWTFRRDCPGGLCMRSAFVEGGLDDFGAADATRTWDAMGQLIPDLAGIPAPGSDDVATDLGLLNLQTGRFDSIDPDEVMDVKQNRRVVSNQLEVGYKGLIGSRFSAGVDVFVKHDQDIVSPSRLEAITPNIFYDNESLESYLSGFVPPDSAAALADQIAGFPVGTVSPNEIGPSSELLFVFLQGGDITFWGVDVMADAWISDEWLLSGTYSWKSDNFFEDVGQVGDILLGVPQHMGTLRLEYRRSGGDFSAAAQVRARSSFDMSVASWVGTLEDFVVLDLDLGYRPAWAQRIGFYLNATNVLNEQYVEVIGAKVLGRLITARVQLDL